MSAKPRVLPLTPAMRVALMQRTTGTARRSILLILACILFLLGVIWMVYRGQPEHYDAAMWLTSIVALATGGLALIVIGIHAARQRRASTRALRLGTFSHYDGGMQYRQRYVGDVQHQYLKLRDNVFELDDYGIADLLRLRNAVGGVAVFVPEAAHLLAAWERDGTLLYAAPDYALDADSDAPRPGSVPTLHRPSVRRLTPIGRVTALLNLLARSVVAMIALGVALLALALYVAAPWTLLT